MEEDDYYGGGTQMVTIGGKEVTLAPDPTSVNLHYSAPREGMRPVTLDKGLSARTMALLERQMSIRYDCNLEIV